jgi:hypothetical protein
VRLYKNFSILCLCLGWRHLEGTSGWSYCSLLCLGCELPWVWTPGSYHTLGELHELQGQESSSHYCLCTASTLCRPLQLCNHAPEWCCTCRCHLDASSKFHFNIIISIARPAEWYVFSRFTIKMLCLFLDCPLCTRCFTISSFLI